MAGIIADQATQAAAQEAVVPQGVVDPQGAVVQEEVPQEGAVQPQTEQPTDQEQDAFSRVEVAAKKIIHSDKKVFNKIANHLKTGADDPVETLANVTMFIFDIVDDKSGGKIPEAVILRGAEVILDLIIKVADNTEAMVVSPDVAEDALTEVVGTFAERYGLDPADVTGERPGANRATPGAPVEPAMQGGQQNGVIG